MRIYKITFWVTLAITCTALSFIMYLHYYCGSNESSEINFWINIWLAIFGSSILSMIVTLIQYFVQKAIVIDEFINYIKYFRNLLKKIVYMDNYERSQLLIEYEKQIDREAYKKIYKKLIEVSKLGTH